MLYELELPINAWQALETKRNLAAIVAVRNAYFSMRLNKSLLLAGGCARIAWRSHNRKSMGDDGSVGQWDEQIWATTSAAAIISASHLIVMVSTSRGWAERRALLENSR